ncbi:MAG: S8 family serine peptidase [Desulfobacteraceae bacterium]|nr:S8 family serine peptidase [Desulfobacteraceae bacterium]
MVKFKPAIDESAIESLKEGRLSHIPSIDVLATKYRIRKMWKQFPGSRPPKIPTHVDLSRIYKVKFPPGFNPEEVASEFSQNPNVEYAQVIGIHPVYATTPNDTYFVHQWALSQRKDHDVDGPQAWDLSLGDSTVVLAIVDTGVDWRHPDLGGSSPDYIDGNIWINWAEYDGIEGEDDDENGYIDDVRGWDWVDLPPQEKVWSGEDGSAEDNDPMDFAGHGTHCSGIASAITYNGTGVAGLGWGCKIMALRAGWLGSDGYGYVGMDFCAEAIVYATDMGATAINCSWGSSDSGGIADAVDYAIANGVLIVVAAGNEDSTAKDYLATRGDCIDVASTNPDDKKSYFSNYGSWVDVSAPGSRILSTYYDHNTASSAYAIMGGTSMSAPHVVGLIGLIKAYQPTLSADEIKAAIFNSADNIEAENPGYVGELGAGRINAHSALLGSAGVYLASYDMAIDDSAGGDANLRPDPGETDIALTLTLKNMGLADATNISAVLTTADPFITIVNGSSNYYDLTAGNTGDSLTPYRFDVATSCFPGHIAEFTLSISADSGLYTNTEAFKLRVGRPPILIWNHDDGDLPFNGSGDEFTLGDGEEVPFEVSLENLGYEFETLFDLPGDLTGYQAIIAVLGYYSGNETLMTSAEQTRLIDFMDAGGDVYIEGLKFGYYYSSTTLYSYFHCDYLGYGNPASTGNVSTLNGPSSAITEGMSFAYDYHDSPDHYVDEISVLAGASLIWEDQGSIGRGVSYDTGGASQRVHTTTMLGGMNDGDSPNTRDEYVYNVFFGFCGLSPTPVPVLSLTVSPSSWPIGTVDPGSTTQSTEANDITIINDGTIVEAFSLCITSISGGWAAGLSPGSEQFVMKALFCGFLDEPGADLFKDDDIILMGSPSIASDTQFGDLTLSDNAMSVDPSTSVDLWLQFQAPTDTTETTEQTIVITVGAHAP